MKIYGKTHNLKSPEFFIDKKQRQLMAKYTKIDNPMLKRRKSFLLDFANTMSLWSIIIYCVASLLFGAYVLSFIHTNSEILFKTVELYE